jgi:hypothetical protein
MRETQVVVRGRHESQQERGRSGGRAGGEKEGKGEEETGAG